MHGNLANEKMLALTVAANKRCKHRQTHLLRHDTLVLLPWPVRTASPSTPLLSPSSTSLPCSLSFPFPSSSQMLLPKSYPSYVSTSTYSKLGPLTFLDSLVAARVIRRLLPRISRLGPIHFSRLSRRVPRVAQGELSLTPLRSAFMTSRVQEINDAKNDLRGKGVTVD